MLIETCDFCGEPINEIDRSTGAPKLEINQPRLSLTFQPTVMRHTQNGGASISRAYVLCSTECGAKFAAFLHMCFQNPKYRGVPVDDLMEAFFKDELKPLQLIEGETEVTGERDGQPETNTNINATRPNVTNFGPIPTANS